MSRFKRGVMLMSSILVLALCGCFSVFLMASGYESLYGKSVPFVHTIDEVDLKPLSHAYDLDKAIPENDAIHGNYGKLVSMKLPGRAARLDIVAPMKNENTWLARANTLHMLIPEQPRNGNVGVALFYCRSGFRTIAPDTLPSSGANIFVDTDRSWRYVYRVTSTSVAPISSTYVLADGGDTSKLLIACQNEEQMNVYVEATLLSVQGIDS